MINKGFVLLEISFKSGNYHKKSKEPPHNVQKGILFPRKDFRFRMKGL